MDAHAVGQGPTDTTVVLSAEEEAAALELRDPHLVERILAGFEAAGAVGARRPTSWSAAWRRSPPVGGGGRNSAMA